MKARTRASDLSRFCLAFSQLLDAGVPLSRSLAQLEKQFAGRPLGARLAEVRRDAKAGVGLADAFGKHPETFDEFFRAMLAVAEARGGYPEIFRELARHYEVKERLTKQVFSALIYPAIVLTFALLLTFFLSWVILPLFASFLEDMGRRGPLPLPSRVLMAISAFMTAVGFWLFPAILVAALVLIPRWYRTAAGKRAIDGLLRRIPVLGNLYNLLDQARFARAMAILVESGIDYAESLRLAGATLFLDGSRGAVAAMADLVEEGTELAVAADLASGFLDFELHQAIETGEESGNLPQILDRVAANYEERAALIVKNLGTIIQPVLYVALGGIVLFVILAVILPYLSLITAGG